MVERKDEMVDIMKPKKVSDNLVEQLNEIEELFTFGEKLYPYEKIRGPAPEVNEDLRRKQIARAANFGPTSAHSYNKAWLYGLGSVFLYSRVGANSLFDFGPLRRNIWTSAAVLCMGTALGALVQA